MMYPLVRELAATSAPVRVPVAVTCRVLGFSTQAYYKWKKKPVCARQEEEQHLISILKVLHEKDPEGGYRVLADDLTDLGYSVSERRVWRLCHITGIRSTITTRKRKYTVAGPPAHDDLVNRKFRTDHPNRLWLGDITEHPTKEGKLYLCAFKDTCSNEIVGYSMDSTMTADLAVNALKMALSHRGHPTGVVVHTDRGSQGGFNWSSQHFDFGGVQGWRRSTGLRRRARFRKGLVGSGGRIGRCGRRCARLGGLSPRGRFSGSSGV